MKWHTVKYLCKEGILGLWKNRLMALASAGTIVLCLLILGMSYAIANNIDYVLGQIESKIGITAYINEQIEDTRLEEIGKVIQSMPYITEVRYVSKEEALRSFASSQENDDVFDQFKNDNPLPASFEVQVDAVENHEAVAEQLKKIPELQVTYFEQETDIFININQTIQVGSMIIIGCLIVIALLLITNTIKLTVYVRRKEINIMKYIGATDAFIRLPFVIEGVTIGLIGCIIPTAIIYYGYEWVNEMMVQNLGQLLGGISLQPMSEMMTGLIPIFGVLGIGIGALGSAIAIRKHLKV